MAVIETFEKHSTETYSKAVSYAERLPSGATPSSASVAAIDLLDGSTAGSVVGSTAVTSTTATFAITGGTDGHDYLITLQTTLSNANVLTDQVVMRVRDRPI
jgi:hypothetical protein